uniref:Uncharacterized protein n=1 Tax=Rhizophora mucronata TaxID=61149 RepID=A0A2P2N7X5_RHIMU
MESIVLFLSKFYHPWSNHMTIWNPVLLSSCANNIYKPEARGSW